MEMIADRLAQHNITAGNCAVLPVGYRKPSILLVDGKSLWKLRNFWRPFARQELRYNNGAPYTWYWLVFQKKQIEVA